VVGHIQAPEDSTPIDRKQNGIDFYLIDLTFNIQTNDAIF
jgi:hypothetical protein